MAAVEKGFGGCMIGSFYKPQLKELLNLPEGVEPNLIVVFGKPAEKVVLTDVGEDGRYKVLSGRGGRALRSEEEPERAGVGGKRNRTIEIYTVYHQCGSHGNRSGSREA
ncbi:MAG: nitroreductase family protein [Lachnospiraceae bacterium]